MVTKTIVHFEIPAGDPEKLSKFYADVFGWKFEKVPMPGMDYWMIRTGPRNKSVGGGMYKKTSGDDLPRNYVQVDKIDGAIELFKSAGGREIMGKQEVPETGYTFIGVDPEGNLVGLYEPFRRRAGRARRPAAKK